MRALHGWIAGTATALAAYACGGAGDGESAGSSGAGGQSDASAGSAGTTAAGAGPGGSAGAGTDASTGGASGSTGTGGADASGGGTTGGFVGPELGLKVAFFGDQGLSIFSRRVLDLIVAEGADFVLHLGDFDYDDNPAAWEQLMNDGLGAMPWFAIVGNHDTDQWAGYRQVIDKKLATMPDAQCVGEPGVKHSCTYRGLHIMLSGVGLLGSGHEQFLRQELGASQHLWRLCTWHLNQRDFQLGTKSDETGFAVHRECAAQGAMILNGHEHSYARTMGLTDVGNRAAGHGAVTPFDDLLLAVGRTFVAVSGAGGSSLRSYDATLHSGDTWWASGYTANWEIDDGQGMTAFNVLDPAGAAFLEFGHGGDPSRARGYYKTIGGRVTDEFYVTVDSTGFGTTTGAGGAPGAGGGAGAGTAGASGGPWDPGACATFCAKCAGCASSPGFDEGDCRYQSAAITEADCLAGCAAGATPGFDPLGLPTGWEAWTCSEFDTNI